jgi:hypothetical protein
MFHNKKAELSGTVHLFGEFLLKKFLKILSSWPMHCSRYINKQKNETEGLHVHAVEVTLIYRWRFF